MSGTDRCVACGAEVCTIPGMDSFVRVTHCGTTEYENEYYCDEGCLERSVGAGNDQ